MATFRRFQPFQHPSEEAVADRLVRQLHSDAIVIGNYLMPSAYGGPEIDVLVLHPCGIVLCEVKHWFGKMVQFGVNVTFEDGYTQPNPMHGLMYKAKILRSYLMDRVKLPPSVSVQGCLVIDGLTGTLPAHVVRDEYVFTSQDASKAIDNGHVVYQHGRQRTALSAATIGKIADTICAEKPSRPSAKVGHFIIDEEIGAGEFTTHAAGRCLHVTDRNVLLQRWQLEGRTDQKQRTLHRLERETAALARLEAYRSPAFPLLYDAFRDPDDWNVYWAVLELVEGQTLEMMAERFRGNRRFREGVVNQLDEALRLLRAAGIVHRNIHETTILVRPNEQILLGGFEFCSQAEAGTIRRTRPPGRPIAPESLEGKADVHTDIYDAACLLLRLLGYRADENPAASARSIRHAGLRSAFVQALSRSPAQRPDDLQELSKAIKEGVR